MVIPHDIDPDGNTAAAEAPTDLPTLRGFIPSTLIDWPGKIAAILFLPLCNMRCPYCHAGDLLSPSGDEVIPWSQVRQYLDEKRSWIDGVVLCGGEPTLHATLPRLCNEIHDMGLAVKLDTNGSRPDIVSRLADQKLIDAVSMDLKTTLDYRMRELARTEIDIEAIDQTVTLLLASSLDVEFRTTCCPEFVDVEVVEWIARRIGPTADRPDGSDYVLQRFDPDHCLDPAFRQMPPYSAPEMEALLAAAKAINPKTRLRTT